MPQLTWSDTGERLYEAGVDRGVLYVEPLDGVAWNGLTSVSESPTGGDADPYYMDGVKYYNGALPEEFEATINAYFSPPEFDECDGTTALTSGMFATMQRRKPFGFSYRTKIGNDIEGVDHGYKIHIVYGALATPTTHSHDTIGEQVEAGELSWNITTKPVHIDGHRPTAHLIIDSRTTPDELLGLIESYLYGTELTPAQLPSPRRLMELYGDLGDFIIVILADGLFSAEGWSVEIQSPGDFALTHDTVNMIGDGLYEAGVSDEEEPPPPPPVTGLTFFLIGTNAFQAEGPSAVLNSPNSYTVDHVFVFTSGANAFYLDDGIVTPPPVTPTFVVTFTFSNYTADGTAVNSTSSTTFSMDHSSITDHGDNSFHIIVDATDLTSPLGEGPLGISYLGGTP